MSALPRTTLILAAKINKSLEADYRQWVESCEQDRRDGFRPHYCEHGTSNWTDYDNICGGCEDGVTMADGVERRTLALDKAKRRVEKINKIIRAASDMRELVPGFEFPQAMWDEVERLMTVR